jgi:hypothetical protein
MFSMGNVKTIHEEILSVIVSYEWGQQYVQGTHSRWWNHKYPSKTPQNKIKQYNASFELRTSLYLFIPADQDHKNANLIVKKSLKSVQPY